jgi:hypothetical protein
LPFQGIHSPFPVTKEAQMADERKLSDDDILTTGIGDRARSETSDADQDDTDTDTDDTDTDSDTEDPS